MIERLDACLKQGHIQWCITFAQVKIFGILFSFVLIAVDARCWWILFSWWIELLECWPLSERLFVVSVVGKGVSSSETSAYDGGSFSKTNRNKFVKTFVFGSNLCHQLYAM